MPNSEDLIPRRRLTIGVTGHRLDRLGIENVPEVEAAVGAILADVTAAAGSGTGLRLVTSLAEGADCIAADHAVAAGWTLDVVLPFARDDYADDFEGRERDAFLDRLAVCAAVMELDGSRNAAGGDGVAYERAGRIVLAQSDILLAVWDGDPAWGRGGAAQIVAEAVIRGIPVIHVDPAAARPTRLLWTGLDDADLGAETVETVATAALERLPVLVQTLLDAPVDPANAAMLARVEHEEKASRLSLAVAYPLLLAVVGVRRLRRSDFSGRPNVEQSAGAIHALCSSTDSFAARLRKVLSPRFARADAVATRVAQLFRSVYVSNFALSALAVLLSLLSVALPAGAKPVLLVLEVVTISVILGQTSAGNRRSWHRIWLDNRALAERLRCLAISAQLGNLDLRIGGRQGASWFEWYARATAREIGLPSGRIDDRYLACVRADLLGLIEDQLGYLKSDAHRMHELDHRLHRLGTILFAVTAAACGGMLMIKLASAGLPSLYSVAQPAGVAATILGASLPAIGAAIYGIRTQGDFGGIAARNQSLARDLAFMRNAILDEPLEFDTLSRRGQHTTKLLTRSLASWLQTSNARPLTLPG
jgi:hypothetical protein